MCVRGGGAPDRYMFYVCQHHISHWLQCEPRIDRDAPMRAALLACFNVAGALWPRIVCIGETVQLRELSFNVAGALWPRIAGGRAGRDRRLRGFNVPEAPWPRIVVKASRGQPGAAVLQCAG